MVITTAQLHSTKPQLRFCAGSNLACSVLEIHDGEDLWQWSQLEIRLNAFCRSTISQKQFIIIIIWTGSTGSISLFSRHSSQRGRKSYLKKTAPPKEPIPTWMTLLKSQQKFETCLKSNFLFTSISNVYFKRFSRWLESS